MSQVVSQDVYIDRDGRVFLNAIIEMRADGTLTLPREVLDQLRIHGAETFTFELDVEEGSLKLFAVGDDSWAYEPETAARLRAAHAAAAAGSARSARLDESGEAVIDA